ncbi:MAG TPA: PH domain-containing protein, partial [Nitrososphaeraceae archaeon]|nr:PH domain-containing protein [Nitrososphaeraceae archaeon]
LDLNDSKNNEDKEGNQSPPDGDNREEVDKISDILNPDEKVLLVAKQSKIKPGGSVLTPNTIYATDRRIIIRDPYMLGIKANLVDIPYDIITSLKLEKGILSSTIRFKAVGIVSSNKLGMMDSIIEGEDDQEGVIEAIPKDKADDLMEIIRSGMKDNLKSPPENTTRPELVTQKDNIKPAQEKTPPPAQEKTPPPAQEKTPPPAQEKTPPPQLVTQKENIKPAQEKTPPPQLVTQKENIKPAQEKTPPTELATPKVYVSSENSRSLSIADELEKLAKLREKGELTDQEFNKLKQNLINKNNNGQC